MFFRFLFVNQVATTSGFALLPDTLSAHERISTYSRVGFDDISFIDIDINIETAVVTIFDLPTVK